LKIIINISPIKSKMNETINSLNFSTESRRLVTSQRLKHPDGQNEYVKELENEIYHLNNLNLNCENFSKKFKILENRIRELERMMGTLEDRDEKQINRILIETERITGFKNFEYISNLDKIEKNLHYIRKFHI
jgi:hypothetical protein